LAQLHHAGLPVPKPEWLDSSGADFIRPAFIMQRCTGRSDPSVLLDQNSFGFNRAMRLNLGRKLCDLMVRIHAMDWRAMKLDTILDVPDLPTGATRLKNIVAEIEQQRMEPYPELAEAIEWLRRRIPPAGPLVLTHGDFRSEQALIENDGTLTAMLDWEFARLSDPLDEIAYFYTPVMAHLHIIPGVWDEHDFIRHYEMASGMQIDPIHLHWWKTLNMLWVMSYLMQAISGVVSGRTDAVRTNHFNARLFLLLQRLMDSGAGT
jgi:aminoglycoside phosphotransferase (APT) family kinase protein